VALGMARNATEHFLIFLEIKKEIFKLKKGNYYADGFAAGIALLLGQNNRHVSGRNL
jgi:hypothetical protein